MGKRQRRRDREAKKQVAGAAYTYLDMLRLGFDSFGNKYRTATGRRINTAFDFKYLDAMFTSTGRIHSQPQMQQLQAYTTGLKSANGAFTGTLWREDTMDQPKYTSNGLTGFTEQGPADDWDLAMGSVRGYRWWKWTVPAHIAGYMAADQAYGDFQRIRGAHSLDWPDGQVEAVCTKGSELSWDDLLNNVKKNHEVPEYRVPCACGFWAYWSPGIGYESIFGGQSSGPATLAFGTKSLEIPVFGSIKGSGRVILGENGFRSQYGELEALCIPLNAVSMLSHWIPPVGGMTRLPEGFSDRGGDGGSAVMNALMGGGGGSAAGGSGSYAASGSNGGGSGWTSVGGGGGSSYEEPYNYGRNSDPVKASNGEVSARLATLETALGNLYPSVKVMSGQDLLTAVFPPDKDYYKP